MLLLKAINTRLVHSGGGCTAGMLQFVGALVFVISLVTFSQIKVGNMTPFPCTSPSALAIIPEVVYITLLKTIILNKNSLKIHIIKKVVASLVDASPTTQHGIKKKTV